MKHNTLVKKIEKIGIKVEAIGAGRYIARAKSSLIWYKQYDSAICVHTPSQYTDTMYDCNCDTYHRTVKAAIDWLTNYSEK